MLIPIKDDNPLKLIRFQLFTAILIAMNVIAFVLTGAVPGQQALMTIATGFGVIPIELLNPDQILPSGYHPVSEPWTLLTYQFLHGSWMHLISNMLFLWILADNVEDAFGHAKFIIFYLLCGIAGGLAHAYFNQASETPLVGASGALAGVMAAYLLLYPSARITMLLGFIFPVKIAAWVLLGGWLIMQFVSAYSTQNVDGPVVAWWAHIGGFAAGLVLTMAIRMFSSREVT